MTSRALIAIAALMVVFAALFASRSPVAPDCAQTAQRCQP